MQTKQGTKLFFDLGTFEGFNFRDQSAIEKTLTAEEVIHWDHDRNGEAEFWPSGDHAGVSLVFKGQTSVTFSELVDLDRLLQGLGGDDSENFLKVYYAIRIFGANLSTLTANELEDYNLHLFLGDCFFDLRKEAAYELFEMYWPEAYKMWESCQCDGLIFETDVFLDSPSWSVEEITFGDQKALIIVSQ